MFRGRQSPGGCQQIAHAAELFQTSTSREIAQTGVPQPFVECPRNAFCRDNILYSIIIGVVYSQYLGMIRIVERYLESRGVEHAVLTGKSQNRGEIIERFNNDPACRVYVGSLRAGSTGIDLVAASVVIHYDRWWNAAKEDQATDRVHRIGQKRGVQVFKLVTEGTLEEKISALIEKKRSLMDHVVKETDPGLLKSFTKEELIELLQGP